jgi:hypothetical protein
MIGFADGRKDFADGRRHENVSREAKSLVEDMKMLAGNQNPWSKTRKC